MPADIAAISDWFGRAGQHFDPIDLLRFTPLEVLVTMRRYVAHRGQPSPTEADLTHRDPAFVDWVMDLGRAVARHYFRWQVRGLEHVPATGPALLVGNHNGGILPLDSLFTMVAVRDHLGLERAIYPLAHDLLFSSPTARKYVRKMGVLRAGHRGGDAALQAGHLALVYPGSDLDALRPFHRRGQVDLGGRLGFLRLALRQQVPIIPVVSAGTHEQFLVLTRGDWLVDRLGMRRFRMNAFPLALSLPWGLTSGYFPYLPLPAQTTITFGPPLRWPDLTPAAAEDPAALARCYQQVLDTMQAQLDVLMKGRRVWLGQPQP